MPESTGYAVKNNAESTVADNPLTSSATTLNVAAGQGSRFPSTFPFLITIWDDVTHPDPADDPNMEITECTSRSTDALTIVRGKEETSGVEHANGARVAMLITAGIFNDPTYGISIKLNGIEDNATVDQTKADIDALGINAIQVGGCDTGWAFGNVPKIFDPGFVGAIYYSNATGISYLNSATANHVLTTHGVNTAPTWEPPYSHPSTPACQAATASVAGHATTTQIDKLDHIAANANSYTHPSTIQCNANNYVHPSSRQCTSGSWAAASITGTLAVANGGTGVTGDTYDARYVNGCDTGWLFGNVFKVADTGFVGTMYYSDSSGINRINSSTSGHVLTTHGVGTAPTWEAPADLIFSDTHCPKCGKKFEEGDNLVLHVVGHNEISETLTIPMHKECAEAPKKTATIKRKVMEDQYIFDEFTGEPRVQRIRKMQKKNVTKKRMKKDVELDDKTGEFWQIEDGKQKKKITAADATEEYEEEIDEQIYKDVEFEI